MLEIPIAANASRAVTLFAVKPVGLTAENGVETLQELERRYFLRPSELGPRVYYRLTSNWLELTVRFICCTHDIRELKDAISRGSIVAFDGAGITIASTTLRHRGLSAPASHAGGPERTMSRPELQLVL